MNWHWTGVGLEENIRVMRKDEYRINADKFGAALQSSSYEGSKGEFAADLFRGDKPRILQSSKVSKLSRYLSKIDKRTPPLAELWKMAALLDRPLTDFCDVDQVFETWSLPDIDVMYAKLVEGDVVSIVSPDGFLEAGKEAAGKDLFSTMAELMKRGIEVRYYYPRASKSRSFEDFRALRKKFQGTIGKEQVEQRLSGFQVGLLHNDLFGWHTRHIVVSKWDEGHRAQTVRHVLLFTRYAQPETVEVKDHEAALLWIRLEDSAGRDYYSALCNAAEPIRDLGLYENRLASLIQNGYQHEFQNVENIETYREIRRIVGTSSCLKKMMQEPPVRHWFSELGQEEPECPLVNLLDIGSGDGSVTGECLKVLNKQLRGNGAIRLTSLESAHVPSKYRNTCIANLHTRTPEAPFEKWQSIGQFDLITSIHSFYLIDPSYLLRAYDLLSDSGLMLILSSPYRNNIFNLITAVVDQHLPESDPRITPPEPYRNKVVLEDSFRNFAEDLHAMASSYFGDKTVFKAEYEQSIDARLLLTTSKKLTKLARRAISLFSNEWLLPKDLKKAKQELVRKIADSVENGRVRNDNWVLMVSKRNVRKLLGKIVNGVIR